MGMCFPNDIFIINVMPAKTQKPCMLATTINTWHYAHGYHWKVMVADTCRYTSIHLIPTLQPITMTDLGITCPLVYLQPPCFTSSLIPNSAKNS